MCPERQQPWQETHEVIHLTMLRPPLEICHKHQAIWIRHSQQFVHDTVHGTIIHIPQPLLLLASLDPHFKQVLVEGVPQGAKCDGVICEAA